MKDVGFGTIPRVASPSGKSIDRLAVSDEAIENEGHTSIVTIRFSMKIFETLLIGVQRDFVLLR